MFRTHAALAAVSLWLFSTLAGASDDPMHVLSNGIVLTMDKSDQVAQAVAISGERIVGVGSNVEIETLAGGELPPPMKDEIESFRVQLGAAIDSVEFVKRALDRPIPQTP
jgi:hypothetical protein